MQWQNSTNGVQPTQQSNTQEKGSATTALAETPTVPPTSDQVTEYTELDDGVEALIIYMDRTTAEHVFLRAHRRYEPC
jgi:hypothetical protein